MNRACKWIGSINGRRNPDRKENLINKLNLQRIYGFGFTHTTKESLCLFCFSPVQFFQQKSYIFLLLSFKSKNHRLLQVLNSPGDGRTKVQRVSRNYVVFFLFFQTDDTLFNLIKKNYLLDSG